MEEYNQETREQIIKRILEEVERQGSARVGYHAETVLKRKPVPYNIKSKLEATIITDKKYKSRPHPNFTNDFEIMRNPDYSEEKDNLEMQQLRTNNMLLVAQLSDFNRMRKERNVALVVSIVSLIASVVIAISSS